MLPTTLLGRKKEGRKHRQKVGGKGRRERREGGRKRVLKQAGQRRFGGREGWVGDGSLIGREEVGKGG